MSNLLEIRDHIEQLERAYFADERIPEYLSMAASSAMYASERIEGFSRATVRGDLENLTPDRVLTPEVIDELHRMSR